MKTRIPTLLKVLLQVLALCAWAWTPLAARAQEKLVLDDFENGVNKWTTNDKTKTVENPASLIEVLPIAGTSLVNGSRGGGLFAFKAAQGSWASASLKVEGAAWAKIGARSLSFYMSAGGNPSGVEVLIRRTGQGGDEVFRLPWSVRLDVKKWRKVAIPLSDFKSEKDKAPLPQKLGGVYLLQFVMRGNWDARFFSLDQMQIEGTGKPIAVSTPSAPSAMAKPTPAPSSPVTNVSVDYLRVQGKIRTGANVSTGVTTDTQGTSIFPLNENADFRSALRELKARFIRLDAAQYSELLDSGRPAFDFTRLQNAVIAARALGAQPLITISNPAEWTLDARGYASFAAQAARAVNAKNIGPVKNFELACGVGNLSDARVVVYYNSARAAIKKVSSDARVGGVSAGAERVSTQKAVLKGATGLDFLMVRDFGASSGSPGDAELLAGARKTERLRAVAALLDASRWKNASLFVLANLNAASTSGENAPNDGRTIQMIAGAWWGEYLSSASRLADQVFHSDATTPEWGLLDESVRAYPAYYTMWMWNTYAPPGSTRAKTDTSNSDIQALGFNTATAHNLFLVNTQPEERTAQISIRGFPVLRSARIRIYDDARAQPRLESLPKSPYQTITLKPYASAVVQFIEPPKR
jgi:hypothetical protein